MNVVRVIKKKTEIPEMKHSNSAGNCVTKYDKSNYEKGDIPECWTIEMFLHKK